VFNKKAWHYKLILYTFGENFFLDTSQIDWQAMESNYNPHTKEDDFKFIYKSTPKTVNFCPYCRAIVGSALTLPFLYIWRLFPHKPKGPETRASMLKRANRNSWGARIFGAGINFAFAIWRLTGEADALSFGIAIVQIAIGVMLLSGHLWLPQVVRWIIEHTPTRTRKVKTKKIKEPRKPSQLAKKLHDKHDIICPPIFFVDPLDHGDMK
jgi:hypothetical protein